MKDIITAYQTDDPNIKLATDKKQLESINWTILELGQSKQEKVFSMFKVGFNQNSRHWTRKPVKQVNKSKCPV